MRSKEHYSLSQDPCIVPKEPYILPKEPYILHQTSFVFCQKSPIRHIPKFDQNCLVFYIKTTLHSIKRSLHSSKRSLHFANVQKELGTLVTKSWIHTYVNKELDTHVRQQRVGYTRTSEKNGYTCKKERSTRETKSWVHTLKRAGYTCKKELSTHVKNTHECPVSQKPCTLHVIKRALQSI